MITKRTNIVADTLARLTYQFQDKPIIAAIVNAISAEFQELEDAFFQLLDERYLDTAVGVQLDQLGVIIGLARNGLDDDEYRIALKTKAQLNNASGIPSDVITTFKLLTGGSSIIAKELFPATFLLQSDGDDLQPNILPQMNQVKVGGVELILTTSGGEIPFQFDGNDPNKGFSDISFLTGGHFVGLLL
jgi:hypothetical protein